VSDAEAPEVSAAPDPFRIWSIGRHSLVYGVGLLMTRAVSFIMLPIYTRLLTPGDYGVLELVSMIVEVVTIIAGSRIAWGIFHFYHKETQEQGRREVLSTASILLTATYGAAALGTIALAPWIAKLVFGASGEYTLFVRIAAANLAFQALSVVPQAFFQLRDRSHLFVAASLAQLAMQVVFNLIYLIPLHMGVAGVLLGNMTASLLIGLVLTRHLFASVGVHLKGRVARDFIRFGAPLMAMQAATFIVTFGDRYFLNKSGTTTDVGLYALAYQFGFLVASVGYSPFQRVWDPQRFALARRPDRDVIFARVFIYLNVFLLSVALGVAMFGGDVVHLMATPAFYPAAVFVPVLAAAYVFQSWGSFLNLGILFSERTEFSTIANWVAAIVALAGYTLLIPRWLAWGATITTLASLGVRCWLSHVFSQRLWRVHYRWAPVVWLGVLTIAVGSVSLLVPTGSIVVSVTAHVALFAIYAVLVWTLPILTRDERIAIRQGVAARLLARGVAA
jgi:O-antigen/teichoic acid export membrane protein